MIMSLLMPLYVDVDAVVECRHSRAVVPIVYSIVIVLGDVAYLCSCSYCCSRFMIVPLFPPYENAHFARVVLPPQMVHLCCHCCCGSCI
jgi:hypothetical protein